MRALPKVVVCCRHALSAECPRIAVKGTTAYRSGVKVYAQVLAVIASVGMQVEKC